MKKTGKKRLSVALVLLMALSLLPTMCGTAIATDTFNDTSGHWAASAIDKWAVYDVLKGSDGAFRPNAPITRAEFAAVLDRVMKYEEKSDISSFSDIDASAWYAPPVLKLHAAGIMEGDGNGVMRPTANITREEVAVMIARAFSVPENAGNEAPFPDAANISGWALFLVDGMKAAGYIKGDTAGNFNPKASITRAEVVTILDNMIDVYLTGGGERDCELIGEINGNVIVNKADTTVKNLHTNGNLYITEGVGSGDVTLENVTVGGTTYIRGGGPNSIYINGGDFNVIVLGSKTNTHLNMSKQTKLQRLYLNSSASVIHNSVTVKYDAVTNTITFSGTIDKVALHSDGTATVTIGGIVYDIIPPEKPISSLVLTADAIIKEMILDIFAQITGYGTFEKITVNSDGVIIEDSVDVMLENITVAENIEVVVGNKKHTGTGAALSKDDTASTGGSIGGGGGGSSGSGNNNNTLSKTVTFVNPEHGTLSAKIDGNSFTSGNTVNAGKQIHFTVSPSSGYSVSKWFVNGVVQSESGITFTFAMGSTAATISVELIKETPVTVTAGVHTHNELKFTFTPGIPEGAVVNIGYTLTGETAAVAALTRISDTSWIMTSPIPSTECAVNSITATGYTITGNTVIGQTLTLYGSNANPFIITNAGEMGYIGRGERNSNAYKSWTLTASYMLTQDVELNNWIPIGAQADTYNHFKGVFYGNGHVIIINSLSEQPENAGLFASIGETGVVVNVELSGGITDTSAASTNVGGITGQNAGIIANCAVTADINSVAGADSDKYIGGIAGKNTGIIWDCYSTGILGTLTGVSHKYIGGITGDSFGAVINCYSTSPIEAGSYGGGIVGYQKGGAILNCFALNDRIIVPSAGRVTVLLKGDNANNRALHIKGFPAYIEDSASDGALISFDAAIQKDTYESSGGWLFGATDDSPWKMGTGNYPLPVLYWQTTEPASLEGTVFKPYQISTVADMLKMGTGEDGWSLYASYRLTDDITLSNWLPIGVNDVINPFRGEFDGGGHTVTINSINPVTQNAGLFGVLGRGGVVKNVKVAGSFSLEGGAIGNYARIGGIAGYSFQGLIETCGVSADITLSGTASFSAAGGVVGDNRGRISNCYSSGNVTASANGYNEIGGIAGSNSNGEIENCYASGTIESLSSISNSVGGIVGESNGAVSGCVALNADFKVTSGNFNLIGRVVGTQLGNWPLTNNQSIAISNMIDIDALNHKNGLLVEDVSEIKQRSTYESIGWEFGFSEAFPWAIDENNTVPVLWWEI